MGQRPLWGWLVLFSLALLSLSARADAVPHMEAVPHIFVLHSYHQGFAWTDSVQEGISSVFPPYSENFEIHVEYLDMKRHRPKNISPLALESLRHKLKRYRPSLVITSDNSAFDFVKNNRESLFSGVPIVFCGVNDFSPDSIRGMPEVTGVAEKFDIRPTLDLIKQIHPNTRHVAVVSDVTRTGRINRALFDSIRNEYQMYFRFIDIKEAGLDELKARLNRLPDDSVILSLSYYKSPAGESVSDRLLQQIFQQNGDKPVYTLWDYNVRYGVVGGNVLMGKTQGMEAAGIAKRILMGESASAIPVITEVPHYPVMDYPALLRHGIDLSRLPGNTVLMNKPKSFWERYGLISVITAVVIILEALLIFGLITNLRQRQRAERNSRLSQERYRNLVDNLDGGYFFFIQDADFKPTYVSPSAEKVLGYPAEALIDKWSSVIVSDEMQARMDRYNQEIRDCRHSVNYELDVRDSEGRMVRLEISKMPILDKFGDILEVEAIVHDVSHRARREEQLVEQHEALEILVQERTRELSHALQAAEAASSAKTEFISNMSHELRTPMHAIMSLADMGKESGHDFSKEKIINYFRMIHQSGERLLGFLNNLLDLSKLQGGRMALAVNQIDIIDLVQHIEEEFSGMLLDKNLSVYHSFGKEHFIVECDLTKVSQIFRNLLGNAIKFSDPGDFIRIVVLPATLVRKFSGRSMNVAEVEAVTIKIIDQGVGIPEAELEQVFEKFYQSSRTRTGAGGTGLGLAICKEIAVMHHGRIVAENNDHGGATFTLTLPVSQQISHQIKIAR